MTEDEKKIQEMAQLGTMTCQGKDCIRCQEGHPHEICWPYRRAKMYYEEGYRKADEVRRETEAKLKRLLLVLCNRHHNYYPSIDSYCVSEKVVKLDDIKEQFKKFGVEVEE